MDGYSGRRFGKKQTYPLFFTEVLRVPSSREEEGGEQASSLAPQCSQRAWAPALQKEVTRLAGIQAQALIKFSRSHQDLSESESNLF